jgi:DNA polymerase alpha-associated DNA helicase A
VRFAPAKLVLAGDPRQLPPTVLARGRHADAEVGGEQKAPAEPPEEAARRAPRQADPTALPGAEGVDEVPPDSASEEELDDDEGEDDDSSGSDGEGADELGDEAEADAGVEAAEGSVAASAIDDGAADTGAGAKPEKRRKKLGGDGLRPPRTLETTLFDRLESMYGPSIKRMLTVQYRRASLPCRRRPR